MHFSAVIISITIPYIAGNFRGNKIFQSIQFSNKYFRKWITFKIFALVSWIRPFSYRMQKPRFQRSAHQEKALHARVG